jgi:hypothetical protein
MSSCSSVALVSVIVLVVDSGVWGGFDFADSCLGDLLSRRDASDFVPKGLDDRNQAIYCLEYAQKSEPSRMDGVSWATPHIRRPWSKNVLSTESYRSLRDGFFVWHTPGNKLPGYDHSVPPGQRPSTPVHEFDAGSCWERVELDSIADATSSGS